MLHNLHAFLVSRTRTQIAAISLVLIAIVGIVDHLTGFELSFSIFYLIPVAVGSWYAGPAVGYPICILSVITWFLVDYNSTYQYSNKAILIWNTGVRLGFFAITGYLLIRLRAALGTLRLLAERDSLTDVLNSRVFMQRFHLLFQLALRQERPLCLGYLDLDGFKAINDNFGHQIGDRVLQTVANTLSQRLRASDLVGRLGGDEFALILPDTDLASAEHVFTEIQEHLMQVAAENRWPVGFSIGVAVFHSQLSNPEEAIRFADQLMYTAKSTGKNKLVLKAYP